MNNKGFFMLKTKHSSLLLLIGMTLFSGCDSSSGDTAQTGTNTSGGNSQNGSTTTGSSNKEGSITSSFVLKDETTWKSVATSAPRAIITETDARQTLQAMQLMHVNNTEIPAKLRSSIWRLCESGSDNQKQNYPYSYYKYEECKSNYNNQILNGEVISDYNKKEDVTTYEYKNYSINDELTSVNLRVYDVLPRNNISTAIYDGSVIVQEKLIDLDGATSYHTINYYGFRLDADSSNRGTLPLSYSGAIELKSRDFSCLSGLYNFKTIIPLSRNGLLKPFSFREKVGEVLINDATFTYDINKVTVTTKEGNEYTFSREERLSCE